MARIGIHGLLQAFKKYDDAIPAFDVIHNRIENAINGQLDATNLADGAVTASKIAAGAVGAAAIASVISKIATGQYTGDLVVSREINVGFRARFVVIVRHDNRALFIAWGSTSSALARIQIDNTGVITDGGTDFTGSSANGFTLGSGASGGGSNAAQTYSYAVIG